MIAPVTLGLICLYILPFINNIIYSFAKIKDFGRGFTLIGLKNYQFVIQNKELWFSLLNTIQYAIIVIIFGISISIIIAAVLNKIIVFKSFYRTIYFLPYITMPTVIGLIFGLIFNQEFGILNTP